MCVCVYKKNERSRRLKKVQKEISIKSRRKEQDVVMLTALKSALSNTGGLMRRVSVGDGWKVAGGWWLVVMWSETEE